MPDRPEELASILEDRAARIKAELAQHFNYTPVQEFLNQFDQLHASHVEALLQGHLVRAHEILNEIHELSFKLQKNEFWARHRHKTPDVKYSLSPEAFQRGHLIEGYVGSEAMEKLVKEKMQARMRAWSQEADEKPLSPHKNASEIYSTIFKIEKLGHSLKICRD